MNTIINLIAQGFGVNKLWDMMDGKKTYAAAGLGILTSLLGLGTEVAPILAAHNTAGLIEFIKNLPQDVSWLSLIGSLGAIGIGHKIVKSANVTAAVPVVPVVANDTPIK